VRVIARSRTEIVDLYDLAILHDEDDGAVPDPPQDARDVREDPALLVRQLFAVDRLVVGGGLPCLVVGHGSHPRTRLWDGL
jgi:hypothetical protein